jgi:hypothetical protein
MQTKSLAITYASVVKAKKPKNRTILFGPYMDLFGLRFRGKRGVSEQGG